MKTKEEAVDRALVLGVLEFRARFEGARAGHGEAYDAETARAMAAGATDWLRDSGAIRAAGAERGIFGQAPLSWSREVVVAVQHAGIAESLASILFALAVIDSMPAYDEPADGEALVRKLPFLSDSPFVTREGMSAVEERSSMLAAVKLLPEARIEREEQRASLHLWRARSRSLVRDGVLPRERLEAILAKGAERSRELGIRVDGRGDLIAFGTSYAKLDDEQFAVCSLVAEARVRALRWLLSGESWTTVDMSS